MNHELTRKDIEIVIARYNKDISWSDMYKSIRTVYEKSHNDSISNNYSDSVVAITFLLDATAT
jgi:hypothetical protein